MNKDELDQLATCMGNDVRIHRSFYRPPEDNQYLAKVSQILLALDRGQIGEYDIVGKSLEDM